MHEDQRKWKDLTEEERQEWSEAYMDLAISIEGYNATADAESDYPWCAPWYYEGWGHRAISPEEAFNRDKDELEKACKANTESPEQEELDDDDYIDPEDLDIDGTMPPFIINEECDDDIEVDYSPAFLASLDAEGAKRLLEEEKEMLKMIRERRKNDKD